MSRKKGKRTGMAGFVIQGLTWLALLLALVGSLTHVAWAFSTLEEGNMLMGYVQAVAVDLGMFALALGVYIRKRQGRGTLGLWIGTVVFASLSTYANLLHGLVFKADVGLTAWSILDMARPFALSAVLPLLVVYLSEVAGADVHHTLEVADKAERQKVRKESVTTGFESTPEAAERARDVKATKDELSMEQAMDTMLTLYRDNPKTKVVDVMSAIQRSKTTVHKYLNQLEEGGQISRNGEGVEVLEADRGS